MGRWEMGKWGGGEAGRRGGGEAGRWGGGEVGRWGDERWGDGEMRTGKWGMGGKRVIIVTNEQKNLREK